MSTHYKVYILKKTADGDCKHEIKKILAPWKESCDKPRQVY